MPRKAEGLTALKVKTAGRGRYGDGGGLYLLVRSAEAKSWLFRYTREIEKGKLKRYEMGLGPAAGRTAVALADARRKARALYDMVREGRDPLAEKKAAKEAAQAEPARVMTFRQVAEFYIDAHRAGWRNAKHAGQWEATLATYAYPLVGPRPVQEIDTALVLQILEPMWREKSDKNPDGKPETASRLRGRIEAVLDYARARNWRDGENPARWRGHLENLLPKRSKVARVEHHVALPYAEIGAFMAELRQQEGTAARALEFCILTAARTGEVIGARWSEIDLAEKIWTIPAERMKAGKEHRSALSPRAVEILAAQRDAAGGSPASDAFVFQGAKAGKPLSNMALLMLLRRMGQDDLTAHGFRSTFRDWAAERTSYPSEVAEMALAHVVGDKVEAAYRRGDLFEKRRRLAAEWAKFCATVKPETKGGNIATLRASA